MTALLYLALVAPFSHKPHVTAVKLKCSDCHTAPVQFGEPVGYPAVAKCAPCHPGIDRGTKFPVARLFKLADFVYFDHRFHLMNAIQCEDCHAADASRDATKMSFCQPCHVKTRASTRCNTCHDTR